MFWVNEQRKLGFAGQKMRRRLYDDVIVIVIVVKSVRFLPLILHQSVHLRWRSVSMVNDFTLNCRHILSHSVKEHPYCSRYRINTLVAYWIFFAVSFISLELSKHGLAILSFFKKTKIWNGVFLSVLILHSSQPLPNQFSCYITKPLIERPRISSKRNSWLKQNN